MGFIAKPIKEEFDELERTGNRYNRMNESTKKKYKNYHVRPGPNTYPPTKRPEITISGETRMKPNAKIPRMKMSGGYQPADEPTKPAQSFDSIIMECQDMLSIEDKVQEKYEDWLNSGQTLKIKPPDNKKKIIASLLFSLISYLGINSGVNSEALIVVLLFAFLCSVITLLGLTIEVVLGRIKIKENIVKPSESSKFQFLKESYSGTISNLNERLELVQNKISDQIQAHRKDKESVEEYSDMFGDISEVTQKINEAIAKLRLSELKLSNKKIEINKSLNEYIGESGVIAQKEKEIERLKVAQKLSDRMKTNFHTTMEITKSVDVLTDVIMPGLKQLMSLKIPELIEKVNFDCDKERVFLEINR